MLGIGPIALGAAIVSMAVGASPISLPRPPEARTSVERRGRHLLQIATGCGCHGPNFAGWRSGGPDLLPRAAPYGERFVGTFGSIPAPNITPDRETGIGVWPDAAIAAAIRDGVRPDGSRLHPVMPSAAFHGMADSDVAALVVYLRRLRPIRNSVPGRQVSGPVPDAGPLPPAPQQPPADGVALGRYLVENVSTCGDCHTPRGSKGPEPGMLLAGSLLHPSPGRTEVVPNITPDRETGIGRWKEAEIARYLRTGSRPDGGLAQSIMAGLILTSFSHFTSQEADAIAAYLKSIPPVRHRPRPAAPQAGAVSAVPRRDGGSLNAALLTLRGAR